MQKRIIALFFICIVFFAAVLCRTAVISVNQSYAEAAWNQCIHSLPVNDSRGNVFDCNFNKLTNTVAVDYALVSAGDKSYNQLFNSVSEEQRSVLYTRSQNGKPFLIAVQNTDGADYVFHGSQRYPQYMGLCHIIGYCNGEGRGVTGVERAYNDYLIQGGTKSEALCATNAWGRFIAEWQPRARYEQGTGNGVMLTIDSTLQRICEGAAAEMTNGCIIVMETKTGRICACVSKPVFQPNDIAASLIKNDTSLVNRAVNQYNVGSVFKPLLAAEALEQGVQDECYTCTGSITVDGQTYSCAGKTGHGEMNLQTALEQSCNCYFIHLGRRLNAQSLLQSAKAVGFGSALQLAPNWVTAGGSLPTAAQLKNSGQLAGFSFGQGKLLATPMQVAAFMNTIANDGVYISPTLIEAEVNEDTREIIKSCYAPQQRRVFSKATAQSVQAMLISTVENGIAGEAKPAGIQVGGKTGTAQTGRTNEDGQEELDAWFAGFYPAQNPRYTVVVLMDSGRQTSTDACRVFRKTVQAMYYVDAGHGYITPEAQPARQNANLGVDNAQ